MAYRLLVLLHLRMVRASNVYRDTDCINWRLSWFPSASP